ncbi:hypothetical protein WJX73_005573 [Symbiochloris irregularis]|uniref:Uncharacterized protein n=1 Tax=Symbiochloris irregularis TaxID=706552 RepID=A0AAW1P7M7_9CHLO
MYSKTVAREDRLPSDPKTPFIDEAHLKQATVSEFKNEMSAWMIAVHRKCDDINPTLAARYEAAQKANTGGICQSPIELGGKGVMEALFDQQQTVAQSTEQIQALARGRTAELPKILTEWRNMARDLKSDDPERFIKLTALQELVLQLSSGGAPTLTKQHFLDAMPNEQLVGDFMRSCQMTD